MFVMALPATGHSQEQKLWREGAAQREGLSAGQRARERPKVPSEPGCRLVGLPLFLGALIPLLGGRVGPEAVAEADLGVFLAELGQAARAEPRLGLAGEIGESGLDVTAQERGALVRWLG